MSEQLQHPGLRHPPLVSVLIALSPFLIKLAAKILKFLQSCVFVFVNDIFFVHRQCYICFT